MRAEGQRYRQRSVTDHQHFEPHHASVVVDVEAGQRLQNVQILNNGIIPITISRNITKSSPDRVRCCVRDDNAYTVGLRSEESTIRRDTTMWKRKKTIRWKNDTSKINTIKYGKKKKF